MFALFLAVSAELKMGSRSLSRLHRTHLPLCFLMPLYPASAELLRKIDTGRGGLSPRGLPCGEERRGADLADDFEVFGLTRLILDRDSVA